jgi:hypothetical protein
MNFNKVFRLPSHKNLNRFLLVYPILFGFLSFLLNVALDFQQLHNDFWDTYFIARHLHISIPASLYNPLFPIGYCSFLKLIMGKGVPVVPAIIANIGFGMATLFTCIYVYKKYLSLWVALISLILLSLFPKFFHYFNVGGADPMSVMFFTLGTAIIALNLASPSPHQRWAYIRFLAAGSLMGLSAITRYHVFVGSVLFLIAFLIFYRKEWKNFAIAFVGMISIYSIQWAINLISGHSLFETGYGSINIYNLMYNVNYYKTTTLHLPVSALQIVLQDPLLFFSKYMVTLLSLAPCYMPPVIAAFIVKERTGRNLSRGIALWSIFYFGLFATSTSERQMLIVLPWTLLSSGFILQELWHLVNSKSVFKSHQIYRFSLIALILISMAGLAAKDFMNSMRRANARSAYCTVESYLANSGCTKANQTFATDFDLYFRSLPYCIPYFNGGAPRNGTYLYDKEFPEFPAGSINEFADSCLRRGVRFVILTPACDSLSVELRKVYDEKPANGVLMFRKEISDLRIFEVSSMNSK